MLVFMPALGSVQNSTLTSSGGLPSEMRLLYQLQLVKLFN